MGEAHPVRLVVTDDLVRSRLTVLFRGLLVIPHLVWLTLWSLPVTVAVPVNWVATVLIGRSPGWLHSFLAAYLVYSTHVNAYLHLVADPYPAFTSTQPYPVTVEVDGPARQGRLGALFRWVLALPVWLFVEVLGYALWWLAIGGWFVALALGRVPEGICDFAAYCLRFQAQTDAYSMLLTARYPSLDLKLETPDTQA